MPFAPVFALPLPIVFGLELQKLAAALVFRLPIGDRLGDFSLKVYPSLLKNFSAAQISRSPLFCTNLFGLSLRSRSCNRFCGYGRGSGLGLGYCNYFGP
jgi:hypothetical protein